MSCSRLIRTSKKSGFMLKVTFEFFIFIFDFGFHSLSGRGRGFRIVLLV